MLRHHRKNYWSNLLRRALKQPGKVMSATVTGYSIATVKTALSREAGRLNAERRCLSCHSPIGLGGRRLGSLLRKDARRPGELRVEVWF